MFKFTSLLLLLLTLLVACTHATPLVVRADSIQCETSSGSPTHDDIKAAFEKLLSSGKDGKICTKTLFNDNQCGVVSSAGGCKISFCGLWDGSISCEQAGLAAMEIMNKCENTDRKAGGTYTFSGTSNSIKVHK
ncbi:uncharacterized protein LAJ45_02911 [Morchella importuna]|uniref:Ecp2 effector protein domain-containing protein n=1 Tax=Morchella conica CCBAS932 TaxID=1392247 RepID=A0A3N4KY84_9PEZI|nr:uncharacterized protein LAJ45_02911 [Morchella importuna]KAH8153324.1 hypothetical protein LAJ45_02911 [Morchella importuna]RPB15487.1 hypothetical protein P167DRAFT_533283 [Morchella conica CCBAS932]